jgi:DNA-binding beta-propeller fold protein YncE
MRAGTKGISGHRQARGDRHGLRERIYLTVPFVLCLAAVTGCQAPRAVFGPVDPALTWPADGAPARIRYVGQLRSATDLKPQVPLHQRLLRVVLGANRPLALHGPRGVVATPGGRLWVADPGGRCVQVLDLERRTYQQIDQVGKDPLRSPVGVALGPDGTVLVCDSEAGVVHRLDAATGQSLGTLAAPEVLQRPVAAAYDPVAAEIYVVDSSTHDIKVFGRDGRLRRVIGTRGTGPGELNFPVAVAYNEQTLWVVDAGNGRVQALTPAGLPLSSLGQLGDAPGDLALPKGVAFDSEGHLYVVDARFENVQIFDRTGQLLLSFGSEGKGPGQFALPGGITIDENDRIWVCDTYNGRIQVFQYLKAGASHATP